MKNRSIPSLHQEQIYLGEYQGKLPPDVDLQELSHEIENSDNAIFEAYPPKKMLPRIMEKSSLISSGFGFEVKPQPQTGRGFPFGRTFSISAAVAASLILFFLSPMISTRLNSDIPSSPEVTRVKGADGFRLYLARGENIIPLGAGEHVSQGDVIQIALDQNAHQYGVLLSLDGNGIVTLHYPENGQAARPEDFRLPADKEYLLSYGYQLDDAPLFERFFLVRSDSPIDLETLISEVEALSEKKDSGEKTRLSLPDRFYISDLLLLKE